MTVSNRWIIAAAGVLMQVALGAVYAWSVFRIPLTQAHGWGIEQVTLAFEIAILVLGLASFAGGILMRKYGPRTVALAAAVLYGLGTVLAGRADSLTALYLSYGVIGGLGVGLGYIVPVATLIRWFPDLRGMITGIAVAGFGAGALITAPIAQRLLVSVGIAQTFTILGFAYFIVVGCAALVMTNPPDGWAPAGFAAADTTSTGSSEDFMLRRALGTWQWYALWVVLFLNTFAGIAIISQAAPMAQEISHVSPAVAAAMAGIISIANGAGRFLWAWLSDFIGRSRVFLIMFLVQAVTFFFLAQVEQFDALVALAFIVLLCYGGGFGTMPAFAADYFGTKDIGSIYGIMLTAWGAAGVGGPTLIALVRESTGHYQGAMQIMAILMLVSAVIPLLLRPPGRRVPSEKTAQGRPHLVH